MPVQILTCECGMRLKAPGAKPGRVGRCPRCGSRLQVPGPVAVPPSQTKNTQNLEAKPVGAREPAAAGYQIEPVFAPARLGRKRTALSKNPGATAKAGATGAASMADGLLPVPERGETNWFA